ncbi:hypothetical protein HMPREF9436_01822, partial [Faecalibacterium cf. prausnitzii KLE1255]
MERISDRFMGEPPDGFVLPKCLGHGMMKKNPLSQTLWVCQLPRRGELLWSGTVKCIKPRPLGEVASRSDDGEG